MHTIKVSRIKFLKSIRKVRKILPMLIYILTIPDYYSINYIIIFKVQELKIFNSFLSIKNI